MIFLTGQIILQYYTTTSIFFDGESLSEPMTKKNKTVKITTGFNTRSKDFSKIYIEETDV